MSEEDKIEKISKIKKISKATPAVEISQVEDIQRMAPNKEHFDNLMTRNVTSKNDVPERIEPTSKTSLMDEVRNINQQVDRFGKVSSKDIIAQAEHVINRIDAAKEKLATPGLDLKPATHTLLQNKLAHIDENLRVALSKAGVEYKPDTHLDNKTVNPIERFLGFLTNAQANLSTLSGEVETMHLSGKDITPASMLRMQLKMSYITQEVEFFTSVLNKALDSTKTIMNVQV